MSGGVLDRPITFATALSVPPPPLPAPPSTATPATTTTTPTTTAAPAVALPVRTACRAVAHIGDSTSVGLTSTTVLGDAGQRLDAQYARVGVASSHFEMSGGRSVVERRPGQENGFEVVSRLRAGGFSGCWVIALGTCDAANVARGSRVTRIQRIERMMSALGADPVLWVDVGTRVTRGYWSDAQMQLWNQDLTATLARYPNVRIHRAAGQTPPGWYAGDGIHFTAPGYAGRAAMAADALVAAFPA